jgi:hypothetical protein
MTATARPLLAEGKSTREIVSQRVAPSAAEPSRNEVGTTRSASSESEITVGKIMIDRTMPAANSPSPPVWKTLPISGTSNVNPSQP